MAIKKILSGFKNEMQECVEASPEDVTTWPLVISASAQSEFEPVSLPIDLWECVDEKFHEMELWLYQDNVYSSSGSSSKEHQVLLILESADQERQKFERLKAKFSAEQTKEVKHERERIPEDVRIGAWRRDQGKCVRCDSRERLEYDHIIPVSRGGSNTLRNVEVLCEACNRAKSDNIR